MTHLATDDIATKLAEHRLNWDRIEDRIVHALKGSDSESAPERHVGPYVTVSRMTGAGGTAFARRLGSVLGWPALGGEIVDLIAEFFELDGATLRHLDEAGENWVREVLGDLMPHQVLNRDTYIHYLKRVMHLIGLHGDVVLIGRGANFFLPRNRGISIWLVASEEDRLRWLVESEGLDETAALARIHDGDHRRAHFVRHYFGHDVSDPTLYDMVLNRSAMSDDELVSCALSLCRERGFIQRPGPSF